MADRETEIKDGMASSDSLRSCVTATIEAVTRRLDTLPPSRTLFVLLGENHDTADHHLFQMLVVDALTERGIALAVGDEVSHAYESSYMTGFLRHEGSEPGEAFAFGPSSAFMTFAPVGYARRLKYSAIHEGLSRGKLTFHANDAATIAGQVDGDNELNANLTARYGLTLKSCYSRSVQGILARNIIMAERAVEQAAATGARVYVQFCGGAHTTGAALSHQNLEGETRRSLSSLLWLKAESVLAVDPVPYPQAARKGVLPVYKDDQSVQELNFTLRGADFASPAPPVMDRVMMGREELRAIFADESAYVAMVLKSSGYDAERMMSRLERFRTEELRRLVVQINKRFEKPGAPAP